MWIYNDPMTTPLEEVDNANMGEAKYIRTVGKGGAAFNFTCMTGDSHKYLPFTIRSIHQLLDRGIQCFELLEDGTELELTLANYASDNGGKEVEETEVVIDNDEQKTIKELRAIAAANGKKRCNAANPEATTRNIKELVIDVVSATVEELTEFEDITEIPKVARAIFEVGPNKDVAITWDDSAYDNTKVGTYTVTATVDTTKLPSNITDTDVVTIDFTITVVEAPEVETGETGGGTVNPTI